MSSVSVPVNPHILRWAREEAGYPIAFAAEKVKITVERLCNIEDGQAPLPATLFKKLATLYRYPEFTFFLPFPPKKQDMLAEFRTVNSQAVTVKSPEFSALKRRILALHKVLKEVAELEDMPPVSFVHSQKGNVSATKLVSAITTLLGESPYKRTDVRTENVLFAALREKIQQAGIYVLLLGDVGSHHSRISEEIFRGIAIADPMAPLIIINPYDATSARSFSLIHELTHIALGETGYGTNREQEYICNKVAAEYLVPEQEVRTEYAQNGQSIEKAARHFKVSTHVIARRLRDLGLITQSEYVSVVHNIKKKTTSTGGPNSNDLLRSRLGDKVLGTLKNAVDSGYIEYGDASALLGISVTRMEKVARF